MSAIACQDFLGLQEAHFVMRHTCMQATPWLMTSQARIKLGCRYIVAGASLIKACATQVFGRRRVPGGGCAVPRHCAPLFHVTAA